MLDQCAVGDGIGLGQVQRQEVEQGATDQADQRQGEGAPVEQAGKDRREQRADTREREDKIRISHRPAELPLPRAANLPEATIGDLGPQSYPKPLRRRNTRLRSRRRVFRGTYSSSFSRTSSETSKLAQTFWTSSLSSRASISLKTLRAPSSSRGTFIVGRKLDSAES